MFSGMCLDQRLMCSESQRRTIISCKVSWNLLYINRKKTLTRSRHGSRSTPSATGSRTEGLSRLGRRVVLTVGVLVHSCQRYVLNVVVIIVDDPQMPELIPLAKKADPDRPVIFRSHIEVRDDLVQEKGSAASEVWGSMWPAIKQSDLFISHPVESFVPEDVDRATVGYMPATTGKSTAPVTSCIY